MVRDDSADLEQSATELQPRLAATVTRGFAVIVAEGPDAGAQLNIEDDEPSPLLVGQSPACALRLRDPRVSRRHLAFELVGDRLRVTDLDSTNGTYCSGLAIRDAYLCGGEVLQIGQSRLRIARYASAGARPPSHRRGVGRVLGESLAMRRLYPLVERLAASDIP